MPRPKPSGGLAALRAADEAAVERRRRSKMQTKRRSRERLASRPRPASCELCGQPPGARGLAFDHDHLTGAFRGWLCHRCNLGLGLFNDNPTLMLRAAKYLQPGPGSGVMASPGNTAG